MLAKIDEVMEQATAPAAKAEVDPKTAEETLKAAGKVVVSEMVFAELKAGAQAGVEARAKQLADERDETIQAAYAAGKISRDRVDAWAKAWDKDPEGTKTDLDSLEVRFPVASIAASGGYAGGDNADTTRPFTDEEGDALGALAGLPKGALR